MIGDAKKHFDAEYEELMGDVSVQEFVSFVFWRPYTYSTDDGRTTPYVLGEGPFEKRYYTKVWTLARGCNILRDWIHKEWDLSRTAPGRVIDNPSTDMKRAPFTRASRLKGELNEQVLARTLKYASVYWKRVSLPPHGVQLPSMRVVYPGGAEDLKPPLEFRSKGQIGVQLKQRTAEIVLQALCPKVAKMILWKNETLQAEYDIQVTCEVWNKARD
uniref:Uncharacterized protein n=1 Tax=Chromera velia CCMP2878 TaxID=1169474 RepID=A0A0G4FZF3_9ALVE|eukprot:Cvel_19526.t1-p1 / transcript=Cvel_19526.t1 / gene=Cvel_19526 / organism=Chromera_velia_CCMP2878 / gene_product=hypothetical protein / transcript_product=hypothetical protein / location=Cvel_scaffold1690:19084-20021(-) / protein_length=215 / sequence_SO=supercontig / SO=protein_coding / is_pseudo=false